MRGDFNKLDMHYSGKRTGKYRNMNIVTKVLHLYESFFYSHFGLDTESSNTAVFRKSEYRIKSGMTAVLLAFTFMPCCGQTPSQVES